MTDKENIGDIYLSLGICFGAIMGILLNRMAIGISFGLLFGVIADEFRSKKFGNK